MNNLCLQIPKIKRYHFLQLQSLEIYYPLTIPVMTTPQKKSTTLPVKSIYN